MSRIAAQLAERNREKPHSTAPMSKLVRVGYLAERLDKPESSIYLMVKEGRIPGVVRLGRTIRFKLDEVESWIEAGGESPQAA
jgi:excisionase family DNA binding protein